MTFAQPSPLKAQFPRVLFFILPVLALHSACSAEQFEFKKNDVVAIYGNGLADRMQHDPWVETVLQSHLKGMNVSFRNMSFSGDMVNKKPRNKGFTNDAEYLQHVAPDLTNMKTTLTAEQLVEAILLPSKLIDKDYAQVSVLDVNGKITTGVRISENDQEIVLRNLVEPEPITIKQDDIEAVKEASVSLMPKNLSRQLKNRKEFDDLMKYIIETRKK